MSAPTQTTKRCYYEVLGLPQSCTQDEIRTAYKKMALQRHPDKLVQSGVSSADANALFQELVHAYEVLSDPKERSWYDSHRSQILFSQPSYDGGDKNSMNSPFPDLFSYFSPSCYTDYSNKKTGFYKVYGDVFGSVYANEVRYCALMGLNSGMVKRAPLMGDLESDYNSQVNAFYGYWMSFCTVMDFGWVDKWDAANGVNRKSRRVMEEENKKLRKKARKEFNETVRGLAEFVKKRDKRVIDMMVKKEKEREKKREEELARKKEREREKLEKARLYEEPEWTRVEEVEEIEEVEEEEEEEEKKEFYCAACSKKFKSDKQWKNHEQSKKHKEKVDELRRTFVEEDQEDGLEDDEDVDEEEVGAQQDVEKDEECGGNDDVDDVRDGFVSADDDDVDDLEEKFKDSVQLDEEESDGEAGCDDEDISKAAEQTNGVEESGGSADDSAILEAMLSGRRNKKHTSLRNQAKAPSERNVAESEDEMESMAYNNKKGKKKRRAKKEKGKAFEAEASKKGDDDTEFPFEENETHDDSNLANGGEDDAETSRSKHTGTKTGKQSGERKEVSKRDAETKPKNSSKGRKQKDKSKNSDPSCDKCGEEFESRSKLHKHLKETGHATLKSR